MRCQFIDDHRPASPTRPMCRALEVSTGGYDRWRRRLPGARQGRSEAPVAEIEVIHREVRARSGSPRAHAELVAPGHARCVNTVARLMGGSTAGRPSMPWRWPSRDACRERARSPTRTGAAGMPASTTGGGSRATGSAAA
jgi:hypothetical protein